jgi:hypothetical protein
MLLFLNKHIFTEIQTQDSFLDFWTMFYNHLAEKRVFILCTLLLCLDSEP